MSASRTLGWAGLFLVLGLRGASALEGDSKAQEIVRLATQTELTASQNDHSHWAYRDLYKGESGEKVLLVVETGKGALKKKVEENGRPLTPEELKQEDAKLEAFVKDAAEQARQRKEGLQDDKRAADMLRMLPTAFVWTLKGETSGTVTLAFTPDPQFQPPTMESRVFAAMAGEIVVEKAQHRIQTIRGELTQDVKFGFGLLGRMRKGGTFEVQRRQLASGIWQITESHVHIDGKAMLFKTIGEQDDDVKTEFRRVAPETTLEEAAERLRGEPASLSAHR